MTGRRLPGLMLVCAIVLPLAVLPFALDTSSLWIDELFTAYFAEPGQPAQRIILRAGEDVHPPLYYLALYAYLQLWPPLDHLAQGPVMRSFSLAAAVLTIGVLFAGFRPFLSLRGRLALTALAAGSVPFLLQAVEARSYALTFLFSALLLAAGLRAASAHGHGQPAGWALAGVFAAGLLGALTHYYSLLLAGGLLFVLLVTARTWPQRLRVVATGLAILAVAGAYAMWQFGRVIAADGDANWMQPTPAFIRQQIGWLPDRFLGSLLGALPIGVAGLALAWSALARQGGGRAPETGSGPGTDTGLRLDFGLALTLGPLLFMAAAGLAITYLVVPSFTTRNLIVGLPFFWVCIALVFDRGICRVSGRSADVLSVAFGAVLLLGLVRLPLLLEPIRDEWRGSARFVAALPGCGGAVLPVADFPGPQISMATASGFYGWYLPGRPMGDFLGVPWPEIAARKVSGPWADLVAARAEGREACPLLLWSVHHLGWSEMESARQALAAYLLAQGQGGAAARLRMVQFTSFGFSFDGTAHRAERAFAIILVPEREAQR